MLQRKGRQKRSEIPGGSNARARICVVASLDVDDDVDVVARGVAVAARNETGFRCGKMRVGLNREHEALILARK